MADGRVEETHSDCRDMAVAAWLDGFKIVRDLD